MPGIFAMELPQLVTQFMHKKEEKQELFLSLLFDVDGVVAGIWHVDDKRMPKVTSTAVKRVSEDSWEARVTAAEDAVSSLEVEADTLVDKVILGLPANYLSEEGDIKKEIRPHLKKFTHTLELTPLGFVSIHQALVHGLKREEGVPPTVILLGISGGTMTVSVYKIGALVGQKTIKMTDAVADLEEALHSFHELEVLPSRILMYGTAEEHLEELKRDFLRHPWQTRANFMHFPKIDVLSNDKLIGAISLVGASELATAMAVDEPEEEAVVQNKEAAEEVKEELEKQEVPLPQEEESNVVLVDPSHLGFKRSVDVLRGAGKPQGKTPIEPEMPQKKLHLGMQKPKISLPAISSIHIPALPFKNIRMPSSRAPVAIGAALLFLLILFVLYWYVPRASVTIYEVPKKITKSVAISIDPTATVADPASKILPGKKQEQTVNGEKAIAVTGKKQIGDPAKGAVTIYNKSVSPKTFTQGTVLTAGSLRFTLDSDVSVASASENLAQSSLTYGKATVGITASAIGTAGNLSSGTEFTFASVDSDVAVARNDQALAGGTSKDITVVTRADQDALVKSLTQDLVEKANQDLSGSIAGDDALIDGTVKTSLVDKSFVEELDQQASNLHGKITITITGISYSKKDLAGLMSGVVSSDVPAGYVFDQKNMTVTLKDVVVKKDGKITATADFDGTATPKIDISSIATAIAGKSIATAQEYLKAIPGVGSVVVNIKISPWKGRLPANVKNISLSVAIQE